MMNYYIMTPVPLSLLIFIVPISQFFIFTVPSGVVLSPQIHIHISIMYTKMFSFMLLVRQPLLLDFSNMAV